MGVGGADAVDVMAGLPWELKCPEVRQTVIYIACFCFTCFLTLFEQLYFMSMMTFRSTFRVIKLQHNNCPFFLS